MRPCPASTQASRSAAKLSPALARWRRSSIRPWPASRSASRLAAHQVAGTGGAAVEDFGVVGAHAPLGAVGEAPAVIRVVVVDKGLPRRVR
jgi:hypothetical protein